MHFTSLTVFAALTLLTSTLASPISADLDARHVDNIERNAASLYNIDYTVKRDVEDSGLPDWKREATPPDRDWKRDNIASPPNSDWRRDAAAIPTPPNHDWKRDAAAAAAAAPPDHDWKRGGPANHDWKRDASPAAAPADRDWKRAGPNRDWRREELPPPNHPWKRVDSPPNRPWKRDDTSPPNSDWKREADADAGPDAAPGNLD